ncbi:MAG: hypothetical protein QOI56_756, partial [Actinomycetota bacterium]|nr:hypothetical protein [Actinomycetota bacterium]
LLEHSPLGQVRNAILSFEQRMLAAIESLPLRALAEELTAIVRQVADAIESVDVDRLFRPIHEFGDAVRDKITSVSGDAVKSSIGQVWDTVESALTQAASLLEQLRDALAGVTGAITQFTGTVQPPLTAVKDALAAVSQVLAAFDLGQPADAVVAVLNRARDVVAKIDVSVLPADAVSLVKDAANALKDIEIAPAVSQPITAILDQIDPTALLQEASGFLADVRAQLQGLDPSSLAVGLDAPIDAVLDGLAQLDPSQLRDRIDGLLAPVRDAIGQLDATELLAPATSAFAGLLGQLDATLDPAPIFAPLQELYQPIIDFVEALDPRRIIDLVAPHVGGATEAASGVVGPPAAVTGSADALRSLSSAGDAGDAMLGLRPGDLLLPLVDLHAKLVGALDALDGSVLDQAAHALHQALAAPVAALRPDRVLEALERGLAEAEATLGLVATSARVADAAAGYQRASVRIAVSARGVAAGSADATVAARVSLTLPSVDPLRLVPSGAQADALALARAAGRARAELGGLRAAYATGLSRLQRLVPDFLGGDGLEGTGLRGALAALDPGPVRIEVNQIFDEIGHLLSGFGDVLAAALEEAAMAAEELLLAFNPLGLLDIVTRAHTAVVDQVKALSPEALERLVRFGYAAVRHQLEALDPARLAAEVDELRQSLLDALDGLLDGLLPDPAPFHELQARMAALRPSVLLGSLTAALQPITDLVAALDPDALVQPLIEAIARVRDQLPDVVARIEVAFDEVLAAFPEGGISGVSVSASVSVH